MKWFDQIVEVVWPNQHGGLAKVFNAPV